LTVGRRTGTGISEVARTEKSVLKSMDGFRDAATLSAKPKDQIPRRNPGWERKSYSSRAP
jgi:hypothetical protein